MPDYDYDIFISYRHTRLVRDWVKAYFYDLLEEWLPHYMPINHNTKIFIDEQIETGTEWPLELRRNLKVSRCLLTVWSPIYFKSDWCLAEFHSFREREKQLGLRTEEKTKGLIYAVLFANAKDLPTEVKTIEYNDMSEWATSAPAFKFSPSFLDFEKEMKKLCEELAKMILTAPAWQDNWPIITPSSDPDSNIGLPRL